MAIGRERGREKERKEWWEEFVAQMTQRSAL